MRVRNRQAAGTVSAAVAARQTTGGRRPRPATGRTATLVATSLGFGVIQLDVTVVNVGVRQIGDRLGGGTSDLQWVVSAYTLMFAALILSGGALGDRFGARRVYSVGFVVFVAASMACGLAPDMPVLIAARAVQGAGAALLGACSLALLNHAFPDEAGRNRAVGLWAAGASVALSAGPVVGGLLIAGFGWRSIFFINLPLGLAGLLLTRRHAAETPRSPHRGLDAPGQAAAVVAMGALAGALIEGGTIGYTRRWVLAAFAVALVAGAVFAVAERRSPAPMLPLSLFRRGAFVGPALLGLVVNVGFYGLIFVFSLLLQRMDGFSALRAGLAFLPMTVAILAANLTTGRVGAALGRRRVIRVGLLAMAAGCAGLLGSGAGTPPAAMAGQQMLLGGGLGLLVPPMTSALLSSVDRSRSGVASGALNTMRQTGSVLGVAVFGSLIASPGHFVTGYHLALWLSIALVAVGALLTRWIRDDR